MGSARLKKIPVSQLRLGMHLHALEGRWLDHPFWKTRFTLDDVADLHKLQASRVRECWIDTGRGPDVAADAADPPPAAPQPLAAQAAGAVLAAMPPALPGPAVEVPPLAPPAEPATALADELQSAARMVQRSRAVVSSLFQQARLGRIVEAGQCMPLVDEITQSVQRNPGALVSLARLKTADDYSYMHSVAVCALMVALGRQIGLDEAGCREAGLAGLLHDLGKAAIPLEILNKPGKLSDAEFAVIRTHPERGAEMLQQSRGTSEAALDVCLHHHERMDGRGYPHRLGADRLSMLARMGAVCDVYDAITSNRPYKAGWDPAESIAHMASWKGHFDDTLFQHFVRSLGIYPNGALVRLASGRLAVVVEQNPQTLTLPWVRVFYDTTRRQMLPPTLIDLAQGEPDRITGREPAGRWNFPGLDALWAGEDVLAASRGG